MSVFVQHLRTTFCRDGIGVTDGELLNRFVRQQDNAALAALVQRHAPMVWGVCCRVLHHQHDAEDAFQATFLVLVRKGASIRDREMVANWLHGVAHQTALRVRATAARRGVREKQVVDMPEPVVAEARGNDLLPLLDQELSLLPEKFRVLIVLCDLEGKTRKEVAQQLGCPEGTVASRLARARAMLAKRLVRHGVVLSGVALAKALARNVALAGVPTSVVSSTIKVVTLLATGQAAGVISLNVVALTDGVLKTMLLNKLKKVTVVVAMLCMIGIGGGLLTDHIAAGQQRHDEADSRVNLQADAPGDFAAFVVPDRKRKDEKDPIQPFTNNLGMKFVWIPPGCFMMGSPQEENQRQPEPDEPQHKVTLTRGFYMSVCSVTQEQWQAVMGNNPSYFKGEKNLPVDHVSWNDCQAFIAKLRESDPTQYRLPTEAEWEYSCRAETTTPFNTGKTISTDQANFNGELPYGNSKKGVNRGKTTPVGSFPANAWGLHDMHGNVQQWCQDWCGNYPQKDVVDPQGPEKGKDRVLRGGCCSFYAGYLRSASRYPLPPATGNASSGFRLCFSVDAKK